MNHRDDVLWLDARKHSYAAVVCIHLLEGQPSSCVDTVDVGKLACLLVRAFTAVRVCEPLPTVWVVLVW